jgi:GNAT superfamily N-acetyltransferase
LRWYGDWRLSICRRAAEVEGVSVVMPGGNWFLEAQTPLAAAALANMAVVRGRRPAAITTTDRVKELVRPLLQEKQAIEREEAVRLLRCQSIPADWEGRWATPADLPLLQKYEEQVRRDGVDLNTSWKAFIDRRELAVAAVSDAIVGSIRRYGPAPQFAGVADLYVLPAFRRGNLAKRLVGFAVSELLATRRAVYVLTDQSDSNTNKFYEALGFLDAGTYYKASFK